jgi:hypothetical protein
VWQNNWHVYLMLCSICRYKKCYHLFILNDEEEEEEITKQKYFIIYVWLNYGSVRNIFEHNSVFLLIKNLYTACLGLIFENKK